MTKIRNWILCNAEVLQKKLKIDETELLVKLRIELEACLRHSNYLCLFIILSYFLWASNSLTQLVCDLHGKLSESISENEEYVAKILSQPQQALRVNRFATRHPTMHGSLTQHHKRERGQQMHNIQAPKANSTIFPQHLQIFLSVEVQEVWGLCFICLSGYFSFTWSSRRSLLFFIFCYCNKTA